MAQILKFPFLSHLRAEPASHVLLFRKGRIARSGRGLAFWFRPLTSGVAEVPVDDREQSFLFTGRAQDFQDVVVQGALTFRVIDAERLAHRIDFGIHVNSGRYLKEPLQQLAAIVTQLAQQLTLDWLAQQSVRVALRDGVAAIRELLDDGLRDAQELVDLGIELVTVRVTQVTPSAETEKALQAPTREAIQQEADEATFQRRAVAVEKERAIAENELQNRIELARREQQLIDQDGQNARRRAEEEAEARHIAVGAEAESGRVVAAAKADGIRSVEAARNDAEASRVAVYRELAPAVLLGLAAGEFARKVRTIEHLNLSPDALGPILQDLLMAGTRRLDGNAGRG